MESAQLIIPSYLINEDELVFPENDKQVLKELISQVSLLANRPIEKEKQKLWLAHNALKPTRPVIFCDPEVGWGEVFPTGKLLCKNRIARDWEFRLLKEIFWGTKMGDDYVVNPYFVIPYIQGGMDWGVKETKIGGNDGGSYRWDSPIKNERDLEKLHHPTIQVDYKSTKFLADQAKDIFGDVLEIKVKTSWWWTLGMTWTLANLRGLEQMMLDMSDNPRLLHRLMSILRDGTLAIIHALEEEGLLGLNNDGTYVCSGGFGWTDELPKDGFNGKVRLKDMWGFTESQETVGVSPRMFGEFIFPYQVPIMEQFGLTCYGCCEPIDKRWHLVKQFPNLRRVSISPWSDRAKMAENLGANYIYSMKPNPAELAMDSMDDERIREDLRKNLQITKGCRVEIIMKDNHTIRNEPERLIRWVKIAREEAEAIGA
jgi:hypothetical protein